MTTEKPPQYNEIDQSSRNPQLSPQNPINPYMAMGMPSQQCFQPMPPTNIYFAAPPTPIIQPTSTMEARTTTTVNINSPSVVEKKRCSCCCIIISIIVIIIIISSLSSLG